MSKTICVLANEFPYGNWEPFLEEETKYYSIFDNIIICSLQLRKEHSKTCRNISCNPIIIPVKYISRFRYFLGSFFVLFDKNLYKELLNLKKGNKLSFTNIINLFVFLSRSHHEANVIFKSISKLDLDELTFYSYRFEYQPYVAILLKKKMSISSSIVSRAHGYDLYEYVHEGNYIPLREVILKEIHSVFPCSKYGVAYLNACYPEFSDKVHVAYLGTQDHGMRINNRKAGQLSLLTCSTVVPIKRLELLIEALSKIQDKTIYWTHYGDGPLLSELKEMAKAKLGNNIHVIFKGNVSHSELMREYEYNDYDVFINVSSSEGIPVSIMEAMSFGLPVIATNVGGTTELVDNECGIILDKDFVPEELINAIEFFFNLDNEQFFVFKNNARSKWKKTFNSVSNYSVFSDMLFSL